MTETTIEPPPTPPFTADLPGIGGIVKATTETFVVEEIPAYEPCGDGEHLYLWVEKRDVSSGQLIEVIARHFGISRNDIGTAGNKDRRAITRQWVSIPAPANEVKPGAIDPGVEIVRAVRHRNKLRTGHLRGNRFELEVRELDVEPDVAESRARQLLEQLQQFGFPNYFGEQRFGRGGSTLQLGLQLLSGDIPRTLQRNKRLRRLAASAVQSAAFNEVVRQRIEAGTTHTALLGDRLNRTGERGQLLVTSDNIAQARAGLDDGSLAVTGPMWGPKMYEVTDDVLELETQALARFGLNPSIFEANGRLTPGTRRDLFARFLEPARCEMIEGGLRLGFSLPSGAYATVVLAELTKLDFSAWEAP